jgi:MFS family permease
VIAPPADGAAGARLWRNPDFVRLWTAATISIFGSLVTRTALPFTAILVLNATPFQMGVLAAADLLSQFLFGLVAGAWVDRLRRRPILIAADLGRALLLGTIPLAAVLGRLTMAHLYAVAFLAGILTIFFDVADQAYLPVVVRREDLLEGNSKLAASASVSEVAAFGLGGWLVQWLTGPVAILIDAVSFVVSAGFIGRIRAVEPPLQSMARREGLGREIAAGLRETLRTPVLRALAGCSLTASLSFRIFGAVFLVYTTRELGFAPGIQGMIFAIGGVSSLIAALLASRVTERLGLGRGMIVGVLLMGVSMALVPLARGATAMALVFLIAQQMGDGGFALYDITQRSVRQTIAPAAILGRVNASVRFVVLGAMLAGSFIGGGLGETIGLRATLAIAAFGVLSSTLWLVASPVRAMTGVPPTRVDLTPAEPGPHD